MNASRVVLLASLVGVTAILPAAGTPLVAGAFWALCLAVIARAHPSGVLSFAFLYLFILGMFHLGVAVPLALGLRGIEAPEWTTSPRLGTAVGLFSLAATSFTLGACALPIRRGEALPVLPPDRYLWFVGIVVALVGAGFTWTGVLQLGVLSGGYGAYFERALNADVRVFVFGLMLFPLGLLVAASGATARGFLGLLALVVVVLGPLFLSGFRGPALVHLTALLAVGARKNAALARRVAVAIAALALVLGPAIQMTRDERGDVAAALEHVDPLALVLETGGSLRPLVATAERIESGAEPLWMGRSYALALRRVLPNVSSRRAVRDDELAPSAWVTRIEDPWAFEHGGGIGFSGVAEPYLNFGRPGVVIAFLLLGLVLNRWDRWLSRDPYRAAVGAASFGFVLWTVRNDAIELFRAASLAAALVAGAWILALLIRRPGADGSPAGER